VFERFLEINGKRSVFFSRKQYLTTLLFYAIFATERLKRKEVKKMKRRRTKKMSRTSKRRTPWGGPYIKPLVERVKLDPEQALLAACRTGHSIAYMNLGLCSFSPGIFFRCSTLVRAQGQIATCWFQEQSETPS
jgi:hypothetical protein